MTETSLPSVSAKREEGVLVVDAHGLVHSADPVLSRFFAADENALAGTPVKDILPGCEEGMEGGAIFEAAGNDPDASLYHFSCVGIRTDKTEFPVEMTVTPVGCEKQLIYVCYVRDRSGVDFADDLEAMTHELFRRVFAGSGVNDIAPYICDRLISLFSFPLVWLATKEKDGSLYVRAAEGQHAASFPRSDIRWDEPKEKARLAALAIQNGRAMFASPEDDPDLLQRDGADYPKGRHVIALPLWAKDDVTGVLKIHSNMPDLPPVLVRRLEQFVDRLGRIVQLADEQHMMRLQSAAAVSSASAIMITNREGVIEWVNDAFCRLCGYGRVEVIGKTPALLKSGNQMPEDYADLWRTILKGKNWQGEFTNQHKNGRLYVVDQTITPVMNGGEISHFVSVQEDLTAKKEAEGHIRHLAYYDQLTGLPNRQLFLDTLKQVVKQAKKKEKRAAVLFLDLTNFNRVNDTLGHKAGDDLLKSIADRILDTVSSGDFVARLGGDEFAIICKNITYSEEAASLARTLISRVLEPVVLDENEVSIGAYVGISVFPDDGEDPDRLVNFADMALHKAVQSAPNSYFFFSKEMNSETEDRLVLERDLRRAIENKEFILHYQPQVDLKSGGILGWEALVRWQHPERGMVSPGLFIPIAEDSGLIVQIGEWVLEEALRQWVIWNEKGFPQTSMAVNLSAVQFQRENLAARVEALLRENGVPPARLELELTETVIMQDVKQADNVLSQLSMIGAQLAIDDFGTGYSSLNYLKRFPVDRLKIDQSFVRDMTSDYDDSEIARAIINLGHSLGMEVVSEGVETEAQLNLLREQGCDVVQGFLFARPMPADQAEEYMRTHPVHAAL